VLNRLSFGGIFLDLSLIVWCLVADARKVLFVRAKKIGNYYEYLYRLQNAREGGRHVQRVVKALRRRYQVGASGLVDASVASAAWYA
jgi:hypothetical protein